MNFTQKSMLVSALLLTIGQFASILPMEKARMLHISNVINDSTKPVIFRIEEGSRVVVSKPVDPKGGILKVEADAPETLPLRFIIMGAKPAQWTLKILGSAKFGWEKNGIAVGEKIPYEPSFSIRIRPDESLALEATEPGAAKPAAKEEAAAPKIPVPPVIPAPKEEKPAPAAPKAPAAVEGTLIRVYSQSELPDAITEATDLQKKHQAGPAEARIGMEQVVSFLEEAKRTDRESEALRVLELAQARFARVREALKDMIGTAKLNDMIRDIAADYKEHIEAEEKEGKTKA